MTFLTYLDFRTTKHCVSVLKTDWSGKTYLNRWSLRRDLIKDEGIVKAMTCSGSMSLVLSQAVRRRRIEKGEVREIARG